MSALTLTLTARPAQPVDMSPLVPDRLLGLRLSEIRSLRLRCGNRSLRVRELFRVAGRDASRLRILRSTTRLEAVGAEMQAGVIEVRGPVGAHLGRRMAGGRIRVRGDAGLGAGCGMRGGSITIVGRAGDFVAAALPGERAGMTAGTIYVQGDAGDRVGDRQHRGLIVVEGTVGDYCGSRMLAGTIIVLGSAGRYVGAGMRRGTIILRRRPRLVAGTFNSCGMLTMEMLRLLFRQLPRVQRRLARLSSMPPRAERFAGDLAVGGKGELLILDGAG